MNMFISKFLSKVIGEKGRWRQYKERTRQLPENYRAAVEALERYLMYLGPVDGIGATSLFEDLIELFEQSAASGTTVREIVGDDPVEFVEQFARNYPQGQWRKRERDRLISDIERAAGDGKARASG